uniref:C-factor-like n=1 Tax=Dromaius novaehollandiae TaxID=8790 RepID=A0A8C4KD18_DRONO
METPLSGGYQVSHGSQTLSSASADVADPSAITDAVKVVEGKLNGAGLNLLINNAGVYAPVTLETVDSEEMIRTYKTNAVGPLLMAQAFLPLLKKAAQESMDKGLSCSKAAIVNISTVMGSIQKTSESFFKPVISYRCSKAALNMLTKCQALTYGETGILCVALHPGWVKTDMGTQEVGSGWAGGGGLTYGIQPSKLTLMVEVPQVAKTALGKRNACKKELPARPQVAWVCAGPQQSLYVLTEKYFTARAFWEIA